MLGRAPRLMLALLVTLSAGVSARADEPPPKEPPPGTGGLPPKEAPAYTGVYKVNSRSKDKPTDEWTFVQEDTITIAMLNKQSRWDFKSDGHTSITDAVSRYTTTFGGNLPPNTARRSQAPFSPVGWEFGFVTVAAATPAKPVTLGTLTIAGQPCTNIQFSSTQYGKPEFCVAKTGIVLRFANKSLTAEAVYEAQSVDETAPDKKLFSVPPGTTVEDRGGPRTPKIY